MEQVSHNPIENSGSEIDEEPTGVKGRIDHFRKIVRGVENGEQIEQLENYLRRLIEIGTDAETVLRSLENIHHEAASQDDSDSRYEFILRNFELVRRGVEQVPSAPKL
jgi:hypothetical protein